MFVLYARFPALAFPPSRRALGLYGALGLAQARDKATEWLALELARASIRRWPRSRPGRRHCSEQALARERSFAAVAEAFIAEKLPPERKGREVEREICSNVFLPAWGGKTDR